MKSSTTQRVVRNVVAGCFSLALAILGACGRNSEPTAQPNQPTAPQATTNDAAQSSPNASQPAATSATDVAATSTAQQVSETDDGSETVNDTTPTTGSTAALKLASAAGTEAKVVSTFKEGVHFQRLVPAQPTSVSPGQVEVVEFFWYGCPHCFAIDPKLEAWRQKNKPNYVVFQRVPGAINDASLFQGRVFYAAELLGKLEELHTPIFREIHLNGNPLNSMDKVKAFFTSHDVAPATFDKIFASSALENKLQNAAILNRRYRIQSVPAFVVNGKYIADVVSAGGEEQLLQLLNELAAREHSG